MIVVKDILNGYKNYFIPNPLVEEKAKLRAEKCAECIHKKKGVHAAVLPDIKLGKVKGFFCNLCKCPLSVKVRSENHTCPKNKW